MERSERQDGRNTAEAIGLDMGPPSLAGDGIGASETLEARSWAEGQGLEFVQLSDLELSPNVIGLLPESLVQRHVVVPVRFEAGTLYVATADPLNLPLFDQINLVTGFPIKPVVAVRRDIQRAISQYYGAEQITRQDRADAWFDDDQVAGEAEAVEHLTVSEEDGHIVRLVNSLLRDAIETEASDIHFEPAGDEMVVRMRLDGILHDSLTIPAAMRREVTTRIKVLARMDITERRKPQDGHITTTYRDSSYDLRVSILPTIDGEKTVVRVLDKQRLATDLPALGLDAEMLAWLQGALGRPHGMILVTGPTGSGKTTSLYAMLRSIDAVQKNVITVENPVEYRLERVNQIQVNTDAGQTFGAALRAILRQDPDVIMVGEIRDLETAEIAVQAALTGHLVLSTLHTNDAATAITRLRELGIPPYLLSSCVTLTVAQRLVRRVCPDCSRPVAPDGELLAAAPADAGETLSCRRAVGCSYCQESGYRGRRAVFEILRVDAAVQQAILDGLGSQDIKRLAVDQGMPTLYGSALHLWRQGVTTAAEVRRVIAAENS